MCPGRSVFGHFERQEEISAIDPQLIPASVLGRRVLRLRVDLLRGDSRRQALCPDLDRRVPASKPPHTYRQKICMAAKQSLLGSERSQLEIGLHGPDYKPVNVVGIAPLSRITDHSDVSPSLFEFVD